MGASARHLVLIVLCLFVLVPVAILAADALRSSGAIKAQPIGVPAPPLWQNFAGAWTAAGYGAAFVNSLVVCAIAVAGVLVLAALSGYGLARMRVRGSGFFVVYYLIGLTLPAQLYLTPLFIAWVHLDLTNNLFGLAIIYWGNYTPFSVLLLRSYFLSLPVDFEEAARVDGASELQVLRHVVAPLSWPAIATVAVMVGVWAWNEYLFALTFLNIPSAETVAVRFYAFTGQYISNFADIAAAGVMMVIPPVLLFLLLQRRFIQGLSAGGLKG
ncbi:MAG: carbohydrate ABC transporter permease [Candidatus Dormiibacterota bacterium]